jgi:hypothetical protein
VRYCLRTIPTRREKPWKENDMPKCSENCSA